MSLYEQKKVHRLLYVRSKRTTDSAGRDVQVLGDDEAVGIADECRCKVNDIFVEALSLDIYPYRYLRNREIMSTQDQLRLAKSRVTVVGAGGLGGYVILLLARLGIGQLVVVDSDTFDESNLNRQALCNKKALGKSKSEEALAVVRSINPGVEVLPYQLKLDQYNALEILAGSDVVVDALDNVPDRFVLEGAAKKIGIPLVHGALAGFEGQLMTIFPDDPGLKHLYGNGELHEDMSKSPDILLGVPALTPSIIATFQTMEVFKILLKRGRVFRNVMVHVDLETGRVSEFSFIKA